MAIAFTCPECGKPLKSANPISPGKKVRCPGCGALFSPGANAEIGEEDRPTARREEEGEKDRPRHRRRREDELDHEDHAPRRKRRTRAEDDQEEDYDGARKRKVKGKKSGAKLSLILGLSGGGVVLVVVLLLSAFVWPGFLRSSVPKGGPAPKGGDAPNQQWEPDPAYLDGLAAPSQFGAYHVRPPIGYAPVDTPAPPGGKMYALAGDQRTDGTAPQLMMLVITPPPGESATLEQFMDSMVRSQKKLRNSWTQSAIEYGTVNGFTFMRTRWSGTDPQKGWKMHGFIYITSDGPNLIAITSQDVETYQEQALKLAEAAVLTFKAGQVPPNPLVNELAAPTKIGAYEIRLPNGYEPLEAPKLPLGKGVMYLWAREPRPDMTRPTITIAAITFEKKGRLIDFLGGFLKGASKNLLNWSQSKMEAGERNGMKFLRARFSGTTGAGQSVQGVAYAWEDGNTAISAIFQDFEPHHSKESNLGEAALFTLKKK